MTSATTKKPCAKCNKGGGTAMCYGCEQGFCTKHFNEHRQELSQQMDNIVQERDVLRTDLTNEQGTHPLLARINQWEQDSITKIQVAAQVARADLQQLLRKAKDNLKTSVTKMTEELQSCRESDDYTEVDIKKWTDQLQKLRQMLDSSTTTNIDYGNDTRSFQLIKVIGQQLSHSFHLASQSYELTGRISPNLETSVSERFVDIFGKIALSNGGLVATCLGDFKDMSYIGGISWYSSGVHYIRFRIEQISNVFYSFFGIIDASEKLRRDAIKSTSSHGWRDLHYSVIRGEAHRYGSSGIIQTGDEITLMLDCDNRQIKLKHHQTNQMIEMSIDLRLCPFPWKIIVLLLGKDDCVRILQ